MKYVTTSYRLAFLALAIALSAYTSAAQMNTSGRVVEVIDAKNVTVIVAAGRLNVELQFIEVPEPEQQLHGVVKAHLENLLRDKAVQLRAIGFQPGKTHAQLFLNGVDVACQMLRDGAAWHIPREVSGQDANEYAAYAEYERAAKKEKRGVWSIPGLEPAWLFRSQKTAAPVTPVVNAVETPSDPKSEKRKGYWSDKNPWLKEPGGMTHGYNAATQTGFLGTSLLGVRDGKSASSGMVAGLDMTYFYVEKGDKGRTGFFVISILAASGDTRFRNTATVSIHIDGKDYKVNRWKQEEARMAMGPVEKFIYRVEKSLVHEFAHGGDVHIKIGEYHIRPDPGLQMLLYNMLQAAS